MADLKGIVRGNDWRDALAQLKKGDVFAAFRLLSVSPAVEVYKEIPAGAGELPTMNERCHVVSEHLLLLAGRFQRLADAVAEEGRK